MPQKIADIASDPNNPTEEEWLHFGWDSFIALNWPHLENGIPGKPDTSGDIVSDYLGDGVNPPYPDAAWYTFNDKFQMLMWNALPPGPLGKSHEHSQGTSRKRRRDVSSSRHGQHSQE